MRPTGGGRAVIERLEGRTHFAVDLPVVSVVAPYKGASETGPAIRAFFVQRAGDLSQTLTVNLAVGGSATNGVDYGRIGSSVTFAPGQSSIRVAVRPVDDVRVERHERVTLAVLAGEAYALGEQTWDYIRITDNDAQDPRTNIAWTKAASSPIWRSEATRGVVNGKIYVFGGFIGMEGPVARSDVYDPKANTWTRIADLPKRVTHVATAVDGTKIYLVGGWVGTGPVLGQQDYGTRDVWVYDTAANTYTAGPSLPAPRGAGAMVKLGRELHYLSGTDPDRVDHTTHWVLNLDDQAAGWTESVPLPAGRNHVGAAVVDGHIFVIGGQIGPDDTVGAVDSFYVWHPTWSAWRTLPDLPAPRSHHNEATLVHKGRILVLGGIPMGGGDLRDVTAYDPKLGRWTNLTPLPEARFSGVGAIIDDVIYYATGQTRTVYRGVFV